MNTTVLDNMTKLVSGKDARVYITIKGVPYLLYEASAFNAGLNPSNQDVQTLGSHIVGALPTGYSVTASVSEYVYRDDVTIGPILEAIKNGEPIVFDIQTVLDRTLIDGQEQRFTFRNCVPDGTIDIIKIAMGEVSSRDLAFRVNAVPEVVKLFTAA